MLYDVALDALDQCAVTVGQDKALRVFNVATGMQVKVIQQDAAAGGVARGGLRSADRHIYIFDAFTGPAEWILRVGEAEKLGFLCVFKVYWRPQLNLKFSKLFKT